MFAVILLTDFTQTVSILGLRSYVDDVDVKDCLSQFGEVKSEVIRLKTIEVQGRLRPG